MSTRDDDILDFDFFDEEDAPSWEEPEGSRPNRRRAERGRRGRGSGFRPPRNLTPLLRLIGLIALAILVVVLLVVWVEGCTTDAKLDRNRTYLADIGPIGNASARLGQQVGHAPDDPGPERRRISTRSSAATSRPQRTRFSRPRISNAPGPMVGPNEGAVEALQYRVNGLRGPAGRVQGGSGRDGRERCRRAVARADAAPAGERHHLVGLVPGACQGRPRRTRGSRASTSRPPSSSPRTTSSARARSPRSGSGSRERRPAGRRPVSTAAGSRT